MRETIGRVTKAAAGVAAVLLLSLACLTSVRADVTPQSVNGFQHFADCLHALLTNSAEHQAYCGPGIVLPNNSLSSGGGGKSAPIDNGCPIGMLFGPNAGPLDRVLVAGCACVTCSNGAFLAPSDLAVGDRVLVACCPAGGG